MSEFLSTDFPLRDVIVIVGVIFSGGLFVGNVRALRATQREMLEELRTFKSLVFSRLRRLELVLATLRASDRETKAMVNDLIKENGEER
jgi:hypothetical protein